MLFEEFEEDVQVWRLVDSGIEFTDPVWTLIATIKGRFEPIQGIESFLNNQNFSDVTDIFMCDYIYRPSIKAGDGLIDSAGIQRRIVGEPEDWKWDLLEAHSASKCQRAQWVI